MMESRSMSPVGSVMMKVEREVKEGKVGAAARG